MAEPTTSSIIVIDKDDKEMNKDPSRSIFKKSNTDMVRYLLAHIKDFSILASDKLILIWVDNIIFYVLWNIGILNFMTIHLTWYFNQHLLIELNLLIFVDVCSINYQYYYYNLTVNNGIFRQH